VQTTATDDPAVCLSVTEMGCAKMADQTDILFGVNTPGDPRNTVLDVGLGVPIHYTKREWAVLLQNV